MKFVSFTSYFAHLVDQLEYFLVMATLSMSAYLYVLAKKEGVYDCSKDKFLKFGNPSFESRYVRYLTAKCFSYDRSEMKHFYIFLIPINLVAVFREILRYLVYSSDTSQFTKRLKEEKEDQRLKLRNAQQIQNTIEGLMVQYNFSLLCFIRFLLFKFVSIIIYIAIYLFYFKILFRTRIAFELTSIVAANDFNMAYLPHPYEMNVICAAQILQVDDTATTLNRKDLTSLVYCHRVLSNPLILLGIIIEIGIPIILFAMSLDALFGIVSSVILSNDSDSLLKQILVAQYLNLVIEKNKRNNQWQLIDSNNADADNANNVKLNHNNDNNDDDEGNLMRTSTSSSAVAVAAALSTSRRVKGQLGKEINTLINTIRGEDLNYDQNYHHHHHHQ